MGQFMRFITLILFCLFIVGCTPYDGKDSNDIGPGSKACPLIDEPTPKVNCTNECNIDGWHRNCVGMLSSTGGDVCDFASKPIVTEANCSTTCEDGTWKKDCIGMPSTTGGDVCDFGTEPPITKAGCSNTCNDGTWQQTCT
jgi:hypothetical protein